MDLIDPERFSLYLIATAAMVVFPGPANLYAIAAGARGGAVGAIGAMLGMNAGTMVWAAGAALGLGALMAAAPQAFVALALFGAGYLAWLGVSTLRAAHGPTHTALYAGPANAREASLGGFMVQIANPKALAYFVSLLPPFLDPARPFLPQLALLVGVGIAMDMVVMTAYGLGGAAIARRFDDPGFAKGFARVTGSLLIGIGVFMGYEALIAARH